MDEDFLVFGDGFGKDGAVDFDALLFDDGEGSHVNVEPLVSPEKGSKVLDIEEPKKIERSRKRMGSVKKEEKEEKEKEGKEKKKRKEVTPEEALKKMGEDPAYKDSLKFLKASGDLLHCNLCGKSFSTRANVRLDHINSDGHKKKLTKDSKSKNKSTLMTIEESLARTKNIDDKKLEARHRLSVMDALMESGIAVHAVGPKLKE